MSDELLHATPSPVPPTEWTELVSNLYPGGPRDNAIWERAGGNLAELDLSGSGRTQWWGALRLVEHGGPVSAQQLLRIFAEDYPENMDVVNLIRSYDSAHFAQIPSAQNTEEPDLPAVDGRAFICYARGDSSHVDKLQRLLKQAGIHVWRDVDDLEPGIDWRLEIRRAITSEALAFLACFSKASAARGKGYQNEELYIAIEQIRLRHPSQPWLIPIRFDECEIPYFDIGAGRSLTSLQVCDLFGERTDQNIAMLLAAIRRIFDR